jgi:hypothetical protein
MSPPTGRAARANAAGASAEPPPEGMVVVAHHTSVLCRILVAVAVLVVSVPASTAQAAEAGTSAACTEAVFLGLRGSGEDADPLQLNMGETVYAIYQAFESNAEAAGITVTGIGLDKKEYPAATVLPAIGEATPNLVMDWIFARALPSVVTGSASLGARLRPYLQGDRSTCLVLAGYSQGAWAIAGNLMTNSGYVEPVMARLSGVALLGDPWFDPTSSVAYGDVGNPGILRDPFFAGIPKPGQGRYYDGYEQVRSYCSSGDPLCNFGGFLDPNFRDCLPLGSKNVCGHFEYAENGYTGAAAQFLFDRVRSGAPAGSSPRIDATSTYREGPLVYARVQYSGDATGFGFRGTGGAGWAEESHPFTDPSYGRVSAGQVDYPFNLACGESGQYESDVEFWVYGDAGRSAPVIIHLSC